jgi:hypothetical protein
MTTPESQTHCKVEPGFDGLDELPKDIERHLRPDPVQAGHERRIVGRGIAVRDVAAIRVRAGIEVKLADTHNRKPPVVFGTTYLSVLLSKILS